MSAPYTAHVRVGGSIIEKYGAHLKRMTTEKERGAQSYTVKRT